jgi:hypothetical protein
MIRCYTGPLDGEIDGLILAYTQRQAESLLRIGHKRFMAEWEAIAAPHGLDRFVPYCRDRGSSVGWIPREDQ